MTNTPIPTHVKCPFCGHETKLHVWVFAHWDMVLIGTCEGCKKEYKIKRGVAYVPR